MMTLLQSYWPLVLALLVGAALGGVVAGLLFAGGDDRGPVRQAEDDYDQCKAVSPRHAAMEVERARQVICAANAPEPKS